MPARQQLKGWKSPNVSSCASFRAVAVIPTISAAHSHTKLTSATKHHLQWIWACQPPLRDLRRKGCYMQHSQKSIAGFKWHQQVTPRPKPVGTPPPLPSQQPPPPPVLNPTLYAHTACSHGGGRLCSSQACCPCTLCQSAQGMGMFRCQATKRLVAGMSESCKPHCLTQCLMAAFPVPHVSGNARASS